MSFLSDALFSVGSTALHIDTARAQSTRHAPSSLRKSKSHAGLLTPLVQLVAAPVRTLNSVASRAAAGVPGAAGGAHADTDRRHILYLRMKDAETYDEWKAAATELDVLEGNDAWKEEDQSDEYDAELVAARLRDLDDARMSCDVKKMLFLLRTALGRGLGGMGELQMYKHSHIGTKRLIERYIDSASKTLVALIDVADKLGDQCPIDLEELGQQLRYTRQYFGRSALLLSGGGTFGMNHIGVVKCLWDQKLLPRLISGASAGSIVSAVLCSKTDDEIPAVMHEFCHGDLDVFERDGQPESLLTKVVRMFQEGNLFDISHLSRVMKGLLGDMTFIQAYNRTRRILNIPVSTSSHFELPRLLNYVTAPNVVIWSAVCTSCSVPLVYKKATLLARDPSSGRLVPWDSNPNATYIDGSVDNDLPMTRLAEMFSVNHFIVSQVNPHVVPFLAKEEGLKFGESNPPTAFSAGPGWLSNGLSLARGELIHRMQVLIDMGVMPNIVTKLRSVLSQRYSGDINIFPQISLVDFPRVLTNPTPEYMFGCMLTGQRATWPKLARIENHMKLELAIDKAIHEVADRLHFGGKELEGISRPSSHGNDLYDRLSSKTTRFTTRTEPSSPVLRRSAPNTPYLFRTSKTLPSQPADHKGTHIDNPIMRIASPSTNAEESSDRDYFADPDSDTTDILSSPSPVTSPSASGPTLWPSAPYAPALTPVQQQTMHNPLASTSQDRWQGKLLNLAMTSASTPAASSTANPTAPQPSSPELRYKRLFHPPGPVPSEVFTGSAGTGPGAGMGVGMPNDQTPGSRTNSRRGSLHDGNITLTLDRSGTRRMLLRKKSSAKLGDDAVE